MEKYVNEDTIIKDKFYEVCKEFITCPICSNLMIDPVICYRCQNVYCKKCIEKLKTKNENCPNKCDNPIFKKVIEGNNLITRFKFKCIKGCGKEILFKDIGNHYNSDCLSQIKRKKLINPEQAAENVKKTGKEIIKLTSMQYNINLSNFINSFNCRRYRSWKNIFNKNVRTN